MPRMVYTQKRFEVITRDEMDEGGGLSDRPCPASSILERNSARHPHGAVPRGAGDRRPARTISMSFARSGTAIVFDATSAHKTFDRLSRVKLGPRAARS